MPLHIAKFLSHAGHQAQPTIVAKRCLIAMLLLLCGAPALAAAGDDVSARLFNLQLSLAEKGNQAAQYGIAEMYEKGLGVAQNMDQALAWYKKSADQGYTPAKHRIDAWNRSTERNSMNTGKPAGEKADSGMVPAPGEAIEPEKTAHVRKSTKADSPAVVTKAKQATVAVSKTEKKSAQTTAVSPQQILDVNAPAKADAQSVSMPAVTESDKTATKADVAVTAAPAVPSAAPKNATPASESGVANAATEDESFAANPCKSPAARFLSHCR